MTKRRTGRAAWRGRACVALAAALGACAEAPTAAPLADGDIGAEQWRPWVLQSSASVRPGAPPAMGSEAERREIDEVLRLQASPTTEGASLVARWSGSPTAPWDSTALRLLDFYFPLLPDVRIATPVRAARVMALLNVAMYDAMLASWDAKYSYRRLSPVRADGRVAIGVASDVPSYPSEHAAVAEAAAGVLAYLFPREDTLAFRAMAAQAGEARLRMGANYRSDVDAGVAIGRAVAQRVIARAQSDGAATPWSGEVPVGPGLWRPTANKFVQLPFDAGAGSWQTWTLTAGSAFRPLPPPAPGSPTFSRDLDELRSLGIRRTAEQTDMARYWATDAPSVIWEKYMLEETNARGLSPVRAARARALNSVAMYDAFVACWEAKFHYWLQRPISADSSLRTVFPTPPFPSYPSGHSTISSAAAEVFAELFPDAADHYRRRAVDASVSRVYAGVHYRFDVDAGDSLGVRVGRAVVSRAQRDGAASR